MMNTHDRNQSRNQSRTGSRTGTRTGTHTGARTELAARRRACTQAYGPCERGCTCSRSRLEAYRDGTGKGWSRVRLESGAACWLAFDIHGVEVRKGRFMTSFARTLYRDRSVEHVLGLAVALGRAYPTHPELPDELVHPILRSFTNALLHCRSTDDIAHVLRGTAGRN